MGAAIVPPRSWPVTAAAGASFEFWCAPGNLDPFDLGWPKEGAGYSAGAQRNRETYLSDVVSVRAESMDTGV
ncbi:hypothetical protein [Allokutzneria oryzae]|uniref:Uncharacterized protein n=1 Tax=Allokutzneria oryzae TaxID=1378989 RepID=A0ABV5ZXJ0_9PSEU